MRDTVTFQFSRIADQPYAESGLLQTPGCFALSQGRRHKEGLPQVGAALSSGRQSWKSRVGRAIQADLRSLRSSFRYQEAGNLRSVRILLGARVSECRSPRPGL